MKIRNGFVSNSSSASFLITFKSQLCDKDVLDVINATNKTRKITTKDLKQYDDHYGLYYFTSMFNDWPEQWDIYNFMRMVIEKKNSNFEYIGLKEPKCEDDYGESHYQEWSPVCWEYQLYVKHESNTGRPGDRKRAIEMQAQIEMKYLDYLTTNGIAITAQDRRKLAKFKLLI